jgi:anti-sigma factor RsiW
MSCSPFDLRDYFLRELPDPQQRLVETHVKTCQPCREELDRLQLTQAALLTLRDEEIPQRIAFVSDKIFEPSPWRRWWAGFWGSAARLGFASAAMLSVAIVVFALRPAGQPARPLAGVQELPKPTAQIVQTVSDGEIQARIDAAVAKAITQIDARQSERVQHLVADLESKEQRYVWAANELEIERKRFNTQRTAALGYSMPPAPDAKTEPKKEGQ